MQRLYDVLVAGEINPDLILSSADLEPGFGQQEKLVDQASLEVGSSSAIFACGAARLGLKVAFIGVTGQDLFGDFMLEALAGRGVDVSAVRRDPGEQTGLSVILNRGGDRAILTYAGAMATLRAEQVTDELLARAGHLHVASYFLQTALQPGLPDLFRRAHALGLSVSLDPNWDPAGEWHGLNELLPLVDVFLPNQAEALALSGAGTPQEAAERLGLASRTVVIKTGAEGALARRGPETAITPALPVEVVDTVGAGDSFDAGFIYGYLAGWDLERSLRLAAACGGLSTRMPGGVSGQPTLTQAQAFLEE